MEFYFEAIAKSKNSGLFLYIRVSFYKKTADSAHSDVIYKTPNFKSISHYDVIYEIETAEKR